MEERGYIEIKVEGKVGNKPLKPEDVDIAEIKDIISDVESFLYPGRADKAERLHISYKIGNYSLSPDFHIFSNCKRTSLIMSL